MNDLEKINEYIDERIDYWHREYEGDQSLSEYLGMSHKDYLKWVEDPKCIPEFYLHLSIKP